MQQIIVSGVGGQGVLFVTKLLAETALDLGCPVLISETHGMAQRGGNVISHLKVGNPMGKSSPGGLEQRGATGFASPLVRPGKAEIMLCVHPDSFKVHGYFLSSNGEAFCNTAAPSEDRSGSAARHHFLDATRIAMDLGAPIAANLVLLGFTAASGRLFCSADQIEQTLERLGGKRLEISLKAFDAGKKVSGKS